jgi:hypothetical protein
VVQIEVLLMADMTRLEFAVKLKMLGIADYTPSMWSDMGKAAEQGASTTDLLVGMGKGMVLAPYRFVKAAQRGDWQAAGDELVNTAFAIKGGKTTVKAVPRYARAAYRGAQALRNWKSAIPKLKQGMQDFHSGLRTKVREKFSPKNSTTEDTAYNPNVKTMAGTGGPLGPTINNPSSPSSQSNTIRTQSNRSSTGCRSSNKTTNETRNHCTITAWQFVSQLKRIWIASAVYQPHCR